MCDRARAWLEKHASDQDWSHPLGAPSLAVTHAGPWYGSNTRPDMSWLRRKPNVERGSPWIHSYDFQYANGECAARENEDGTRTMISGLVTFLKPYALRRTASRLRGLTNVTKPETEPPCLQSTTIRTQITT